MAAASVKKTNKQEELNSNQQQHMCSYYLDLETIKQEEKVIT